MESPANAREIFNLASECRALFQRYVRTDQELLKDPPKAQRDVASISRDFEAWCFNLGVFAAPTASLDQTLRYSDEIRGFVTQLLSILHRNLDFSTWAVIIHDPPENSPKSTSRSSQKNVDAMEKLQGSAEEAIRAISAVLQRLDRLGTTIRKYSTSSLGSRVKAFAEQDNDEDYRLLAKNIVTFKYPTAPSSLHAQLAGSMAYRRLRLRYIRQHQLKTAPKDRRDSNKRDHIEQSLSNPKPTNIKLKQPAPKDRVAGLRNQAIYRPKWNTSSKDTETTPSTTAWTFRPTSSAIERVRRDDNKSVISSSKASTTRMVGHLDDYPEPPTHDQWSQDSKCPTCWRQLMEAELKGKKWRRHVDTDCEPYVCISEDCKQPLQFFSDLTLWENHMRLRHSSNWTQLIHKPTVWICDVDHDDEEFRDHESFQAHLREKHADLSEADCKAVTTLCETKVTRPKHTCPLCGYDLALQQENRPEPSPNTPQEKDMDQLAKLSNHIGGHIRCLAFDTLDHLASDHESVSEPSTDTTNGKARSRSRPPSELKDLDDISCGFPDDDDRRSVSTHDELKTRQEGDFTLDDDASLQIVSIPPEFEEDWEGIRETRSDEEDPILHNMRAYSLWDRAYDNLKKMEPLLVENYEMILSKELAEDAERDSKPVVNQFRGANIHTRRALLDEILVKLLDRLHDKGQTEQAIVWMLDLIAKSFSRFPKPSLPMVGLCLIVTILADVGVKEEFDLARFVKATSKLPDCFARELSLSERWNRFEIGARDKVRLERQSCQLFQNMLEFQLRIVNSGGQLAKSDDAGGPPSEDDNLEIPDIDRYLSTPGLRAEIREALEDPGWTEVTIFEAIRALGPAKRVYSPTDQKNIRRLHRVLGIDPRKVKDQIETIGGGLLKDSHCWLLNHGDFHRFQNDPQTRSLCISGPPGVGKTMLLCGLIDELSAKSTALSYFFCRAYDPQLNSGVAVLRGLLYLLACERPSLISSCGLLEEALVDRFSVWNTLSELISTILQDPSLEGAVLAIDALDECLADQLPLIELIKKPSCVKWIVSTRDRLDVEDLNDMRLVSLHLGSRRNEVSSVISSYIHHKVSNLASEKNLDQRTSLALRELLLSKALPSFLCIHLFIQDLARIQPDQMVGRLNSLPSSLGPLYMELLKSIMNLPHSLLCKRILAVAAVTFRPVTLKELRNLDFELQDVNEGLLEELISTCGSFLTLQKKTICFVHLSAKEFLLSDVPHLIMPSGVADQHSRVSISSIKCLDNTLHEDIYSLRDPGVYIHGVPRLDPDPLLAVRYSCTNWIGHLERARTKSNSHEELWDRHSVLFMFLKVHLLHWFEALSLLHGVPEALEALQYLLASREFFKSPDALPLTQDAYRFLLCHEETITHFPLQVYASALVFSPSQSMVKQLFRRQTSPWMRLLPRIRGNWDSQAIEAHDTQLLSMAWSWDTNRVVSGSRDGTITMWDTAANVCMGNIRNHGTRVNLVAFSTDGRRFASAASDGLIKIWDTDTCGCRMGLFGNAGKTNQVVFSADGTLIAAAFSNGLVKVWSGGNATSVQVFDGRCGSMEAVAFSTDGQILASGSIEGRILLWDVAMGQILQDLEAHGHSAVSMSFSGDGQQLASSFINGTLRVWATATGSQLQVVEVGRAMCHLSFDPKARHCLYTDTGRLEISPSGEASFPGYSLSADNCWILKDGKRILWIPLKYRSSLLGGPVVRGSMVGLVSDSSDILTMRFARDGVSSAKQFEMPTSRIPIQSYVVPGF